MTTNMYSAIYDCSAPSILGFGLETADDLAFNGGGTACCGVEVGLREPAAVCKHCFAVFSDVT